MGSSSTLGLLFEISADPKAAENALANFGHSIDKYIGAAQGTAAKTGAAFVAAGKDLLYVGGIAAGLVTSAVLLAKRWSDAGTAIYEAAEKTGLSAEKLSGLRVAAERNRESFEALAMTLARMEKNLSVGLSNPASDAGKILHGLFGTTKELNDLALLPMDAQIAKVTQRIYGLSNVGERNTALTALMGRGWVQVNSTMQDLGEKGYDPLIARAKALNQFFDAEAAARARQFGFELDEMKIRVEGLALGIGEKLIPSMSQLIFLTEVKLQQSLGKNLKQALRDAAAGLLWMNAQVLAMPAGLERAGTRINDVTVALAGGAKETQGMTDALIAQQVEIEKLIRAQKAQRESHQAVTQAKKEEKTETAEILRLASELGLATATTDAEYREYLKTLNAINRLHDEQARQALVQMNEQRWFQEWAKRRNELRKEEIKLSQEMQRNLHLETASQDQLTEAEKRAAIANRNLMQRSREWRAEVLETDSALLAMKDTMTTVTDSLQSALTASIAGAMIYGKSIGEAVRVALKATLTSIAVESAVRALFELAKAFACMFWNPAEANAHFIAAAVFGKTAALAGVGAALVPGSYGTAAAGGAAGGGTARQAAGGAGAQEERGPTINVYVQGMISSDNLTEVVQQISQKVQSGDVTLHATTSKQSPIRRS